MKKIEGNFQLRLALGIMVTSFFLATLAFAYVYKKHTPLTYPEARPIQ